MRKFRLIKNNEVFVLLANGSYVKTPNPEIYQKLEAECMKDLARPDAYLFKDVRYEFAENDLPFLHFILGQSLAGSGFEIKEV